jgi:hypothetical protein
MKSMKRRLNGPAMALYTVGEDEQLTDRYRPPPGPRQPWAVEPLRRRS